MKTYLKYASIGFIIAFLGLHMPAHALMSPRHDAVGQYSGETFEVIVINEYCVHIPYGAQQIENFYDNEMIFIIIRIVEENIPLPVRNGRLVKMLFWDAGGKNSIACLYYQTI